MKSIFDRWRPDRAMIGSRAWSAAFTLLPVVGFYFWGLSITLLIVSSVGLASLRMVFSPALQYRTQLYFFNNTVINRDAGGQEFRIVIFPNALPFIFAGLNVAIVFSITGALVGEFVGADRGLGNLLMQLNFGMDIAGMFSVLVVLALLGVALHALVRFAHRRLIFWAEPENIETNAP